ncbi:MAG: hypothetical protein ACOC1F_06780, partial [Myxococcota bacterium]
LPDSIEIKAAELFEGDREFGGHGPDVYTKIVWETWTYNVRLYVDLAARETTSDWTTGKGTGTEITGIDKSGLTVCEVCRPGTWGYCDYSSHPNLWDGQHTVAGFSWLRKLYTDTSIAQDVRDGPSTVAYEATYACYGDTNGDDVCTGADCTRCTVSFTGCLPVRYCPLSVQ